MVSAPAQSVGHALEIAQQAIALHILPVFLRPLSPVPPGFRELDVLFDGPGPMERPLALVTRDQPRALQEEGTQRPPVVGPYRVAGLALQAVDQLRTASEGSRSGKSARAGKYGYPLAVEPLTGSLPGLSAWHWQA
jgi:hypothetical protein